MDLKMMGFEAAKSSASVMSVLLIESYNKQKRRNETRT